MINNKIKKALMLELHKAINEASKSAIKSATKKDLTYPPGINFTAKEVSALKNLNLSDDAKSALSKVITDACSYPLFHLFCLLDGVADPEYGSNIQDWHGLTLSNKDENDNEMLHDKFYETFYDFNK